MSNPYAVVRDFEAFLADYVGSKHAIAVDSCTNALFLCCKYLQVKQVTLPKHTYISVPMSVIHAGGTVAFEDIIWNGSYRLDPYPIVDSACRLSRGMHESGYFTCVSFSANKPLNIGKGGMIFTDEDVAARWFKLARYEGREEIPMSEQTNIEVMGYNMYMTPEQASRGLLLAKFLGDFNVKPGIYPDLSVYSIFHATG